MNNNERIVLEAKRSWAYLVGTWIVGILFLWLWFIPTIWAIVKTVKYFSVELAVTNKRVIGKAGIINTYSLDAPLNKIQSISTRSKLWGNICGYGTVTISTAAGSHHFCGIKNCKNFQSTVINLMEEYEEQRIKEQAAQMSSAMFSTFNKQTL